MAGNTESGCVVGSLTLCLSLVVIFVFGLPLLIAGIALCTNLWTVSWGVGLAVVGVIIIICSIIAPIIGCYMGSNEQRTQGTTITTVVHTGVPIAPQPIAMMSPPAYTVNPGYTAGPSYTANAPTYAANAPAYAANPPAYPGAGGVMQIQPYRPQPMAPQPQYTTTQYAYTQPSVVVIK